ncbi:MAG TPA: NAD-dependent epimerase/dehydratase family protein [Acetobacteraceae bacterium]|nr:NAD-dependent epimerase/dehydratase family protein [Acetobacteraceae bacterium]
MSQRALVTGATGFVGRHLVAELQSAGWQVVRAVRAEPDRTPPGTLGLGCDPWTTATFAGALEQARPDVVFHMAGLTWADAPAAFYAANVMLAAHLLDAVAASDTRPAVVLAGSAAEYGYVPNSLLPVREDAPCNPVTHNGISKYAQTLLGLAHARAGLRVLVARIFNPVGTGMPQRLALASFARQLRDGCDSLTVGNLDVARDFIDVAEAARLIVALAGRPESDGQVINICSGVAFVLRPLVETMIRLTRRDVRLDVAPALLRPGEMRAFLGSTARLSAAGLTVQPPDFSRILPALLAG